MIHKLPKNPKLSLSPKNRMTPRIRFIASLAALWLALIVMGGAVFGSAGAAGAADTFGEARAAETADAAGAARTAGAPQETPGGASPAFEPDAFTGSFKSGSGLGSGDEATEAETRLAVELDGTRLVFSAMRTRCEILVPTLSGSKESPEALAELAKKAVLRVEALLSPVGEESDIRKINEAEANWLVRVDPLTMAAIVEAWAWRDRSEGAFEPTIGPVKKLYRFDGQETAGLPSPDEVGAALALTGPGVFFLDQGNLYVSRLRAGATLDLGGIGMGLAADRAAETLISRGVKNALINLGGEMRILGSKPYGGIISPWTVELVDPSGRDVQYVIEVESQAVATSGDYESYFVHEGVRYSHVIDPRTGLPVVSDLAGVTVIHPTSAAAADAVATIVCVLGPEKTASWLEAAGAIFPDGLSVIMFLRESDGSLSATYLSLSTGGGLTVTNP
jgi:thiamine biosynthesis lipoprotein